MKEQKKYLRVIEVVAKSCSVKKVFLKISQNSQENTCGKVSVIINLQAQTCNFIKKETLAQVFSCEFYEICNNTFLIQHLRATASGVMPNNRFPLINFVFIICLQKQDILYFFFTVICNNFL